MKGWFLQRNNIPFDGINSDEKIKTQHVTELYIVFKWNNGGVEKKSFQ